MPEIHVSEEGVYKLLSDLNVNKASGQILFHPKFLKLQHSPYPDVVPSSSIDPLLLVPCPRTGVLPTLLQCSRKGKDSRLQTTDQYPSPASLQN